MTRDVVLYIKGMQLMGENGSDETQTTLRGRFYHAWGWNYVIFDEYAEEWDEITHSMFKFNENEFMVIKKGLMNYQLDYIKGKKNLGTYRTPFGEIMLGVETQDLIIRETDREIVVIIHYAMEMNYEYMADTDMIIGIEAVLPEGGKADA